MKVTHTYTVDVVGVGKPDYSQVVSETRQVNLLSYEKNSHVGLKPSDFFFDGYAGGRNVDIGWTSDGFTNVKGEWLMAFSKMVWSYPALAFECIWPTITEPDLAALVMFESGGRGPINLSGYLMAGGVFILQGGTGAFTINLILTSFLPANYNTALNTYGLKLNKCNIEAYINGVFRGIILFGLPEAIPNWNNNPPYAIASTPAANIAMKVPFTVSLQPMGDMPSYTLGIKRLDYQLVCNDGDPLPPRQYAVYTENTATKWNGLATAAVVTSHPVPVWGYGRKSLLFQSNAAATLAVQVYAGGGWRTITTIVLAANTLMSYNLNAEVPIARCVYTPVGADTIAVAEWHLGSG